MIAKAYSPPMPCAVDIAASPKELIVPPIRSSRRPPHLPIRRPAMGIIAIATSNSTV